MNVMESSLLRSVLKLISLLDVTQRNRSFNSHKNTLTPKMNILSKMKKSSY